MKKRIVLFLAAALVSAGLIMSCGGGGGGSDDDDTPGGQTPGGTTPTVEQHTVTFNANGGTFSDGTTANKEKRVNHDAALTFSNWESDLERGTDEFLGWFDEDDVEYTSSTKITKNVVLTAKWDAALFDVDDTAGTAEHTNFKIGITPGGAHSNWAGEDNGDNSFTWTTGGLRYQFPITPGFDYNDYDFVDIEYTATGVNSIVYKQYGSAADYAAFTGTIANGEGNVITYELRNATEGGVAVQKYAAGSGDVEIAFTKITFKKGERVTIKFNADGGSAVADDYLVVGTKVGNHLPTDTTKSGHFFAGWLYPSGISGKSENDPVSASDTVAADYNNKTLKAFWLATVDVDPIEVEITDVDDLILYVQDGDDPPTVALLTDEKAGGYSVTGLNWEYIFVAFKVTIPAGATLAHYDNVSFSIGGNDWKDFRIIAAPTEGPDVFINPTGQPYVATKAVTALISTRNNTSITIPIIKPLAAGLTGEIEVSINILAPAASEYEFYNIRIE